MALSRKFAIPLGICCMTLMQMPCEAKEYVVGSQQAYGKIAQALEPGDTVILEDKQWQDFELVLTGKGTADAPISLRAQTPGAVVLTGQSNLQLAGEHLVVSGLVFKQGHTPSAAVIAYKYKDQVAKHSRVTQIVIDNYNNPDKQETDYWVALYGQHNRFDHNHLVGKRNKGVTVAVRLDSADSQNNHHRIDHNYFGYRPIFGANGGETLRIGTSHHSLSDSSTLVEHNYFDQTNGEVEIISVKSGGNILRNNVFHKARGTLTLRHGNGNLVEQNIFFGHQVDHTGGIRIINKDQTVKNNYLEGLTGHRFGSGLTIMNGVPDSPINRYHQVENALVANNTFINVSNIQFAAGSDAERSAVPVSSVISNNLFINQDQHPFAIFDDISGITFADNIANTQVPDGLRTGVTTQNISLSRHQNGLLYPTTHSENVGVQRDLPVLAKSQTGVSWYPKVRPLTDFDSGKTYHSKASVEALMQLIEDAESGDVVVVPPGNYQVPKIIKINKVLSIVAETSGESHFSFTRSTLFEIGDGGSLKLDGLAISGKQAPDTSGNSVIRTQKWGMLHNYRFEMENTLVTDLDINHTFHFFLSGKGAFADHIRLSNNRFTTVTGDILQLNREVEDLGIYNAEYVTLHNNSFTDVEGAIANVYRGGTDESTFGPHVTFSQNTIRHVGKGPRNKTSASLFLHGVQETDITDNQFAHSAPIVVQHTVGEPNTRIEKNAFNATTMPRVTELHAAGPHTAIIRSNQIKNTKEGE